MSHRLHLRSLLSLSALSLLSISYAEARRHPPPGERGAPKIIRVTPDGESSGAVSTLLVTFDQPIEHGRVKINDNNGNVVCHPSFFEEQTFTIQVALSDKLSSCPGGKITTRDGRTFQIQLTRPIPEKRQVKVSVNPSHIRSRSGAQMRRPFHWSAGMSSSARTASKGARSCTPSSAARTWRRRTPSPWMPGA